MGWFVYSVMKSSDIISQPPPPRNPVSELRLAWHWCHVERKGIESWYEAFVDFLLPTTLISYHSPNLQVCALNAPTDCIPAHFKGVQNKSIPNVVHVWSSPFLPPLMNSLTNCFQLLTFNVRCTWWLFYEGELQLSATPAITYACCVSKGLVSVRQQQLAIRRNHSFTP